MTIFQKITWNNLILIMTLACTYLSEKFVFSQDLLFSNCGDDITATSGRITSPNYPNNYPDNQDCTWRISNNDDVRIRLTFNDLNIENSRNCQYDYLAITLVGFSEEKFCASQVPTSPQEGSLPATISFRSDGSVGGRGFSINFQGYQRCMIARDCMTKAKLIPFSELNYFSRFLRAQGFRMQKMLSACLSEPCQNGGTCLVSNGGREFTCLCAEGWEGEMCEIEVNECNSNPCQNGGSCSDKLNQFSCSCTDQFYGGRCEFQIPTTAATTQEALLSATAATQQSDVCLEKNCLNGGSCVVLDGMKAACLCLEGFEGSQCQKDVTYANYFIGMLAATCLSVLCMIILAGVVCYLASKKASGKNRVESLTPQQTRQENANRYSSQKTTNLQNIPRDKSNSTTQHNTYNDSNYVLPHQIQESASTTYQKNCMADISTNGSSRFNFG